MIMLEKCTLPISVGEYLLLYVAVNVLLVLAAALFAWLWMELFRTRLDLTQVNFIGTRAYLNEIYREYEGVDDGRLRAWMAEKQAELEQVTQEYETKVAEYAAGSISDAEFDSAAQRYSSYSTMIAAVGQLEEQLAYVDRLKEERDIDVWIVNERPYRLLWTENGLWVGSGYEEQEFIAIANVILIIFLMSSVFSYDKSCGMYGVIRCTKGGRISLFRKKTGIAALVCVLVSGVSYGLRFWEVCRNDPLHCLNAPVQSLRFLEDFPLPVSIGGFLCIVFLLHVGVLTALAYVTSEMTYLLKSIKGVLCTILIAVVPQILYMLGLEWCYDLSLVQPLVYVELLNGGGFYRSLAAVLFVLGIGACSCFLLKIQWCGRGKGDEISAQKRMQKV